VPKIDANVVRWSADVVLASFGVGVVFVGWRVFLWLNFMIKSSGLGSVSAGISYPSGFVFPAGLFGVGGVEHLRRV
jgi:hypothetical protein